MFIRRRNNLYFTGSQRKDQSSYYTKGALTFCSSFRCRQKGWYKFEDASLSCEGKLRTEPCGRVVPMKEVVQVVVVLNEVKEFV